MAIFLQIQSDLVVESLAIADSDCGNVEFPESEPIGQAFIASLGIEGVWLQTSPEGLYRGCYGGIGYTYDPVADVFVVPPDNLNA